ncbi:MAG: glycosyltransferase [Bacteroidaceae bacterium]|nr:glycosyltransferase [Bacteroidaceae bacterium]
MRIAYLSDYNPNNIDIWSGTPYNVFHALQKEHEVTWIGQGIIEGAKWHHRMLGRKNIFHPENYIKEIGRLLSEHISAGNFDVVITCTYHFCPYLKVDIPVIFYSDVTFDLFKGFFRNKDILYHRLAFQTERQCLESVDAVVYASEWARQNAISRYGISADKVKVIEFGANIPCDAITQAPSVKDNDVCNLLFVGRNWSNKGGQIVLDSYKILRAKGLKCKLTIIGSSPTYEINDGNVTIIPWIDKSKTEDLELYISILRKSHFMVLPTRYEAYGIVLCEASAFGIPSIVSNVGGVSQPIKDEINGILLSQYATAEQYAEKIYEIFTDKSLYSSLALHAKEEFYARLNWHSWAKRISLLMTELYEKKIPERYYVPVYAINLPHRTERREHLVRQFANRDEFNVTYVDAVMHEIGAVGLWESIKKAVRLAMSRNEDIIILCEDDHIFTYEYNRNYFLYNIADAFTSGADILSGGIGGFGNAVQIATHRFKVDWFYSTQFVVLSSKLFEDILQYDFKQNDTADGVLSMLARNKQVIFPFISVQKDFGYSDVTQSNTRHEGIIEGLFRHTTSRLLATYEYTQRKKEL